MPGFDPGTATMSRVFSRSRRTHCCRGEDSPWDRSLCPTLTRPRLEPSPYAARPPSSAAKGSWRGFCEGKRHDSLSFSACSALLDGMCLSTERVLSANIGRSLKAIRYSVGYPSTSCPWSFRMYRRTKSGRDSLSRSQNTSNAFPMPKLAARAICGDRRSSP